MKNICFVFILAFLVLSGNAQNNTVGLLHIEDSVSDGYTLFSPLQNSSVYLINNCGDVINEWTFTERPQRTCYLLENGNLLRVGNTKLEIRDWNNNIVWSVLFSKLGLRTHHDIEPMPNGNILGLVKEFYSDSAIIANGRDRTNVGIQFYGERIVEIQPIGLDSATIVWEWSFFDHLVQDHDSTKPNYGIVSDHPELFDVNLDNDEISNFMHGNAIDYNEDLDQILVSYRNLNEIVIIDHSTTTLEASSHTGGNSNKGGDIIWRWGNPRNYGQGTKADQKLFRQHDVKWIDSGFVHSGLISVFNNSIDSNKIWSAVHRLEPSLISYNYDTFNSKFLPLDFSYTWSDSILGEVFYEATRSGVQSTETGNMLICETSKGQISEITKGGNNLWTYKNPHGLSFINQFDSVSINYIFRATKYPLWYKGIVGKNLTPQGKIEDINSLTDSCYLYAGVAENKIKKSIFLNPAYFGEIRFSEMLINTTIQVLDISGKIITTELNFNGSVYETDLKPGVYIVRLLDFDKSTSISQRLVVI